MARTFVAASSEYLEIDQVPITAAPFTVSAWFQRSASASGANVLVFLGDKDVGNQKFSLVTTSGRLVRWEARNARANESITTTTSFNNDTWAHACSVEASTTDRRVYLNGAGKATGTVTSAPADLDRTSIGRDGSSELGSYATGRIAHVAIWNVALSDDDVLSLASGANPLRIRRGNLVAYWPLNGKNPELDVIGALNLTVTGTTISEEPPISNSIVAPP